MGIDCRGMMIVGVDYEELPNEVLEEIEEKFNDDVYGFIEHYRLDNASLWCDSGIDGMIIGKQVEGVFKKDLDKWVEKLKKTFDEVESILKVKPKLIGTQDIW